MSNKVLILTEAGKNIGLGHYTRCSALRDALIDDGGQVKMLVYLNEFSIDDNQLTELNWLDKIGDLLDYKHYETIVVDSYLAKQETYNELKRAFKHVVVIDDYNRINYNVNLLINPNVFFNAINYSNQKAKCVGGKEFVILRKEFRQAYQQTTVKPKIEEVLITMGGSDFRNLLPLLANIFLAMPIKKIIVIAPENVNLLSSKRLSVLPLQDAQGMYGLMQQADLVVSACGQTLHELASLGKPTIGIGLDIDQVPNQKYYLEKGFLHTPISWNTENIGDKIKVALELFMPLEKRQDIAETAPLLIDSFGVNNIVSAIKNCHA